jgi:methylenetetrahydrofolate dehydrogenase (NADP+) / methenyltetrahydrofolate cyclohydrolase
MSAKKVDGKKIAEEITNSVKKQIENVDPKPKLVIINASWDNASEIYIKQKAKMCAKCGIKYQIIHYENSVTETKIETQIEKLNADKNVTGILVQLPLYKHLNKNKILNTVSPTKDVDGLTLHNTGKLFTNQRGITPATPKAIIKALEYTNVNLEGKNAVVIGRSNLVGKPTAQLLLNKNCTVTICHSKTRKLDQIAKNTDIIIVAAGKEALLKTTMLKEGSVVIDVGITKKNGKISGDVEKGALEKTSYYTPVPGGIGPITTACLMENVMECYKIQKY